MSNVSCHHNGGLAALERAQGLGRQINNAGDAEQSNIEETCIRGSGCASTIKALPLPSLIALPATPALLPCSHHRCLKGTTHCFTLLLRAISVKGGRRCSNTTTALHACTSPNKITPSLLPAPIPDVSKHHSPPHAAPESGLRGWRWRAGRSCTGSAPARPHRALSPQTPGSDPKPTGKGRGGAHTLCQFQFLDVRYAQPLKEALTAGGSDDT